jgi:hypothetical protein
LTPLWSSCTVAAPSSLSPSVWREKERRNVNKNFAHQLKIVLQPHPSPLLKQATSWTPLTLSTASLPQPEPLHWPHIAQTDIAHPSLFYKTTGDHSLPLQSHFTPTLPPYPPQTPRTTP